MSKDLANKIENFKLTLKPCTIKEKIIGRK